MAPTIVRMTGFEAGSVLGSRNGNGALTLFDFSTPSPEGVSLTVQSTNTRGGGYALRTTSTVSQVANFYWTASGGSPGNSLPTTQVLVGRFWFCIESLAGAGASDQPALMHLNSTTGGGTTTYFEYDEPSGAVYMTVGTGTTQKTPPGTIVIGSWVSVDFKYVSSSTTWTCDWSVNGVPQTQAVSGAVTAQNVSEVEFGTNSPFNIVLSYDDIALSATAADYPLPDMHVVGLPVAASGTHNTTADFQQTANNGTSMVAISAPEALVKDLPPKSGATTDAVGQTVVSSTAYLEFTHAQIVASLPVYAVSHSIAGWLSGGSTGTLAVILQDGASQGGTLGTAAAPVVPGWFFTSTSLMWTHKTYATPPSGGTWTAALVNALRTRVGFSSNITGTPGINAAYLEVAIPGHLTRNLNINQAVGRAASW